MHEIIIYPGKLAVRDTGVPIFGVSDPAELRPPDERRETQDVRGPEVAARLRMGAIRRILYFGHHSGIPPYMPFPNAEHTEDVPFKKQHWEKYGNMESKAARTSFTLDNYPTRLFPEEFDDIVREVLRSPGRVLQEWNAQMPRINEAAKAVYEQIGTQMTAAKTPDDTNYSNGARGAFKASPVFYKISSYTKEIEIELWNSGLSQMATELHRGDTTNVQPFLELFRTINDPITPLRSTLYREVGKFKELYEATKIRGNGQVPESGEAFAAQLALESSFLALPATSRVACVRYIKHQELPYLYVNIEKLPRGEFADPDRSLVILRELVNESQSYGHAVATPITVSHYQGPHQTEPELFIVDGNNRATAMLLMKYADFVNFDKSKLRGYKEGLRRFVGLFGLDIEWERDLTVALNKLQPEDIDLLTDSQCIVRQFAHGKAPALLVQEPNFHTIAGKLSNQEEITLLHPAHQAIYNDPRWAIAIPSKEMTHGRSCSADIFNLESTIDNLLPRNGQAYS